ncbi:MAG: right-handed parallel beta-helix repeat-containing protein [Candidatus Hodarchaeota archaeon]
MKKLTIIIITTLLFGLNIWIIAQESCFITESPFDIESSVQAKVSIHKITSSQSLPTHPPVVVTNDNDFLSQGFTGNGDFDNPYQFKGYAITPLYNKLIEIRDTRAYFVIEDNYLDGESSADEAIYLENVTHGTILNNTVVNNKYSGINLDSSFNNTIDNNTAHDNGCAGIALYYSENNTITKNIAYNNNWDGIRLHSFNHNNTISHNVAYNNTWQGIRLEDNNFNCTIHNNTVYDNKEDGIRLISSKYNKINQNTAYNGGGVGILLLENSNNNTIFFNSLYENDYDGHAIGGTPSSYSNMVFNNTIYENNGNGIGLGGNYNKLQNNVIYNNNHGIIPAQSNFNIISGNLIFNNNADGIILTVSSNNNTITRNTVYNNADGISIWEKSNNNTITENEVYRNDDHGISVGINGGAKNNLISENIVYNNGISGILMVESSFANTISMNDLQGNKQGTQVSDCGQSNLFSSNYYDDWSGTGPYIIDGCVGNRDLSPLINPFHLLPPVITAPMSDTVTLKDSVTIQWIASNDMFDHSLIYNVYYSNNSGSIWKELASGLTSTSYIWDLSSIFNGTQVILKVEVVDSIGFKGYSISSTSFTIENPLLTSVPSKTNGVYSWDVLLMILSLIALVPLSCRKRKD